MVGVRLDAADVGMVADFWAGVLRCRQEPRPGGATAVIPTESSSYPILVTAADTLKVGQNRIHFDLTSRSSREMHETIARARSLGGRLIDIGQEPSEAHEVLADPEGNEFCVIEPGNAFLADTGAVGAINCDGTQSLGYFWSRALGWPLVWDQEEETAVQSPEGGSKVTWSGPPLMPRVDRDRLRLVVAATGVITVAIERLAALGATVKGGPDAGEATLLDPDGNEVHLMGTPPSA